MSLEKPRFRRDLEAVAVEAAGQKYVEVSDRRAGTSFRFYDFEYGVALAFDGLAFDKVVPWVKLSSGLELTVSQLKEFAARLDEMGFLESETGFTPTPQVVPRMLDPAEAETSSNAGLDRELAGLLATTSAAVASDEAKVAEPTRTEDTAVPASAESRDDTTPPTDASEEATTATASPVHVDSTAFPVLPTPHQPRTIEPDPLPPGAPPAWTTPRPMMTPVPITFGPTLLAEQPSPAVRRRRRRAFVLFASAGIVAAMAVVLVALPFLFSPRAPSAAEVATLVAAPGTVLRYFDGTGVIEPVPGLVLKFPAPGKVTRVASPGAALAAGDVAAAVEAARPLQTQLGHQIERLAFYRQMTEAMNQVGNTKEEEQQAAQVEERTAKIAKTLRALANVAVVANDPGQVEEALAHEGDIVQAGSPALRLRSAGFRVAFDLPRGEAALARRLGFCAVEVDGYIVDCNPVSTNADDARVSVDVAAIPPSLLDKPARLARARFVGAFVVPAAAIARTGGRDQVLVISLEGQTEARPVTVAERNATEAILVQGLDAGDRVVIEGPAGLSAGMPVRTR
jgi:multidrug efflux pump subunit AcrA (membrane-fusion protein)